MILTKFIISSGCNKCLSAGRGLPVCHFSDTVFTNDANLQGHNKWKIIPLPDQCSEKCKANFGSKTSCGAPYCRAPA